MTLETSQLLLPNGRVAMNNGVCVTYYRKFYLFQNGEVSVPDIYYEHRELNEKLVLPDTHIMVIIQGGHAKIPHQLFLQCLYHHICGNWLHRDVL